MNSAYSESDIQKLLDAYQQLLGVRISVLNSNFVGLYRSPRRITDFCRGIRQNKTIDHACKQCDIAAYEHSRAIKDTYVYKCHLGLFEAVTPIIDHNMTIGYLMIGQVRDLTPTQEQWNQLIHDHSLLNSATTKKDFYALKSVSKNDFVAMSQIMKACAHSILLSHLLHLESSPTIDLIQTYIERYYDQTLSVEGICNALNISRTTLYNYMKKEFHMSLTQYLNYFRLEKSKSLLESTSKSITTIADNVGYDNYSYFTRQFKKRYNLTPRQYRLLTHENNN